ncbi:MAG TPA: VOC family protein [Candidatus Lumbricidophila sp.]|nr:VOC family protein [Candidatus Lumbricidophila sp.]
MSVVLNPYISYNGNAREAIEFYHSVLGGELTTSTFGEAGQTDHDVNPDSLMHGMLVSELGLTLMVSDTPPAMGYEKPAGISISLSGDDEPVLRRYFEGLSAGGEILQPLETAPWGDTFGMFADKFGIVWLVNILAKQD